MNRRNCVISRIRDQDWYTIGGSHPHKQIRLPGNQPIRLRESVGTGHFGAEHNRGVNLPHGCDIGRVYGIAPPETVHQPGESRQVRSGQHE
jgi:hypothetical protein